MKLHVLISHHYSEPLLSKLACAYQLVRASARTHMWGRALEAVQWLVNVRKPFPGSAGVPPAKLLESMPRLFFIHAGETPALPGW
jgi:hypothetical protein